LDIGQAYSLRESSLAAEVRKGDGGAAKYSESFYYKVGSDAKEAALITHLK